MKNLYVGIDLAINGPHRASVYDPQKEQYLDNSFGFDISFEGFEHLLRRVGKHVSEEEKVQLNFVMEPTGLAWMPLSCYLVPRGHRVYRVSTLLSSDFRKFQSRHVETDRIDCRSLAKLPIVSKDKVYELYLPSADLGALCRKTRCMAKIAAQAASRKARIWSLFVMLNPGVLDAFGSRKFSLKGQVFLRNFANPFKVTVLGKEAFFERFRDLCPSAVADAMLETIYEVSLSTTKIYDLMAENGTLPFCMNQVEDEIGIELDLLNSEEEKISKLRSEIKVLYDQIDPEGYLMTPQGIGETIAPAILGMIGDVSRFPTIDAFRAYFGFIPKKKESSSRQIKGLGIHKAAQSLLKQYLFLAAETARRYDPEFAAFYDRLLGRGLHHYQATCACANKMAGRVYALLKRMQRAENTFYKSTSMVVDPEDQLKAEEVGYKLRDLDGNVIDKRTARKIILEKFPSKAEKRRIAERKNSSKKRGNQTQKQASEKQPERESTAPQESLSDQPRQIPGIVPDNSSMRSGKTLPIKTILEDTFPELFLQLKADPDNEGLLEIKETARDENMSSVEKLSKGGGKKVSKKA